MGAGEELDWSDTAMNRYRNLRERCSQALALAGVALMFALVVQVGFRSVTMERTGSWKSSEPGIHSDWKIDFHNPFETISSIEDSI
jgi:hypothetical protein